MGWGGGRGANPEERRRPEHYETHKHTAVCGQPPADPPQRAANPSQVGRRGPDGAGPAEEAASGGPEQRNNLGLWSEENGAKGPRRWESGGGGGGGFLGAAHCFLTNVTVNEAKQLF